MRTLLIFLLSFLILPFCLAQTAPSFTNGGVPAGTTYIVSGVAVEEDQLFSLSDILTITDLDVGETMTWSIVTGVNDGNPSNGVLAGFPTIATTNGGDIVPSGLTYQPNLNFTTSDAIRILVSDGTFTRDIIVIFNVTPVNDVPSFTLASDPPASNEDAGQQFIPNFLTDISQGGVGGFDEGSQTVTFDVSPVSSTGNLAFSFISLSSGALNYTAAANTNGTATFNVTASDNGTPIATSAPQTFSITVNAVNDKPTFNVASTSSDEDAGLVTISGFVTDLVLGGTDESGQSITGYAVTQTGQLFDGVSFTTAPSISPTGTLTYQAVPDDNGTVFFSVFATDNGSPAETSDQRGFSIAINPINDPPVFTLNATSATVDEDAGPQLFFPLATRSAGGGNDELSQTTSFSVTQISTTGNLTFATTPNSTDLTNTGSFNYEPTPNTNGSATFEIVITDNGTPVESSAPRTITINVTAVNDPPVFTIAANPAAIDEDAGLQTIAGFATAIGVGGGTDESVQSITSFSLTEMASTENLTFAQAPAISTTGELTYQATANTNGTATFDVTLSDDGSPAATNATQTFTITVNAVNDVPTFTIEGNPGASDEDAGLQTVTGFATAISAGGGSDEATQALTFGLTETASTGTLTFSTAPAISSDGELTFQAAPNTNGTANFEVTLSDDGSPVATSGVQAFTITVNAVNDVPSFTINDDPNATEEDAGLQTFGEFANAISAGGGIDESGQSLTFSLNETASTGTLTFSSAPAISLTGVLTYEAAANTNGSATFNVTLSDNGSPVGTSPIQTFTITVFDVNDVPSFTLAADPAATNEDAGLQTVLDFVTDISPGGGTDELSQPLEFNLIPVSTTGNLTFSGAPAISPTGVLTYQAQSNSNGTATFELTLSDLVLSSDGLLPDRTSASQAFTITANSVNDVPTFTTEGNPGASDEDAGFQTVTGFATAINPGGGSDESTQALTFSLTETSTSGILAFSSAPALSSTGVLTYEAAANTNGSATFNVTLSDNGSPVGTSPIQTFTITVFGVNDVPSFTL
ncbi:MAG: Ig-like domain-containing protein, partial [Cyclobacteriaceae bacterium]